jgi:hypothetical protein
VVRTVQFWRSANDVEMRILPVQVRIAAFRLDCTEGSPLLSPARGDLSWIWPVLAVSGVLLLRLRR